MTELERLSLANTALGVRFRASERRRLAIEQAARELLARLRPLERRWQDRQDNWWVETRQEINGLRLALDAPSPNLVG